MAEEYYAQRTGKALRDAASWGTTGAALGSIIPGVGTAIAGGIGAGAGAIYGWITGDDEAREEEEFNEFAESLMHGEVDPEYRAYLEDTLGNRYSALRSDLGNQLARRGLADSTFAGRTMANTYNSERQALANALAQHSMNRMGLGADMLAQRRAEIAQTRQAQGYATANLVGQIMNYNLAKEGLATEANRGMVQYASPAGPPSVAAAPAAPGRTPYTFPKLNNRQGNPPPLTIRKPADGHGYRRNNPTTGRTGYGQGQSPINNLRRPNVQPVPGL